mmetsp:Transcript_21401/g.49817  ORF Transcript_21401/g.49817 Transcript_21401/m.49817 type:complete len:196 (+) Transcript_21401:66-653(+)
MAPPVFRLRRGLLPALAFAALAICFWQKSDDAPTFSSPPAAVRSKAAAAEEPSLLAGAYELSSDPEEPLTAMNSRHVKKAYYADGWRHGGKNMWVEDQLGGNWMNITALKQYTYASGRLKPRVMTKLRMSDHKRAIRYIKRFRQLGIMPYHRLLAKIEQDPDAKRPPRPKTAGNYGFVKSETATKEVSEAVKDLE